MANPRIGFIGTGLMGLVFVSNMSGHDEEADRRDDLDQRR